MSRASVPVSEEAVEKVAERTEGQTPADLLRGVQNVARRLAAQRQHNPPLSMDFADRFFDV